MDSKEKEYAEKLKEQEDVDSLLKEKEKSLESDRRLLDEKLETARLMEEKHRVVVAELDKKANAIRIKVGSILLFECSILWS